MSWEPLNRETAAETQALIERTLGLSRETFAASAFCGQGRGADFPEAPPRERKRILTELLALGIWDALAERARSEARADEDALVTLRARTEQADLVAAQRATLEEIEGGLKQQDTLATEDVAESEYELESAQTATTAYALARERRRNVEADGRRADATLLAAQDAVSEARASQDKVDAIRADLAVVKAAGSMDELERELTEALTAEDVHREREHMRLERKSLATDAEERRKQASEFYAQAETVLAGIGEATCDRCGQTLGEESARRAAASFRRDAEVMEQAAVSLDMEAAGLPLEVVAARLEALNGIRDVAAIRDDLIAARVAAERRRPLEILLAEHKAKALDLPRREKEVSAAEQAVGEVREELGKAGRVIGDEDRIRQRADRARANLDERRKLARAALTALERTRQALENARRAEAEVQEIARDSAVRQNSLDLLRLAERAYGRDGVPALIVESVAIPQIETEANTILDELAASCRVELRTQRALKSGEGLKEVLDIIVSDELGERTFETYSGGEKTRIALALRIGLARLLANRRGAESRLLVIDEPDGLDAEGMERLPIVLERLSSDFDSILIVSHNPLLATAFPQVISVVRDGNRSRIEMGTAMEAA